MAFDGNRNSSIPNFASIPNFSTNAKCQASPTEDDGSYGSLGQLLFPNPSFNRPGNHHTSYTLWPKNAEDPKTQNIARNLSGGTDCDGLTDLYSLVSNILEDGDSLDSFSHTERNPSRFMPIWSPQTVDTKTEASPALFPNHKYEEHVQGQIISKDIKNMCQQFNGFNTSNQWLSKSSNGDMDSYKPHSLKPTKPPDLPMQSMENCFLSTMRESQHHPISNDTSRGTLGPLKNIPIQKNGFAHQGKLDSHLLNAYEDHYIQSCPKLYQQNTPQEVKKLVSHFQKFKFQKLTNSPHGASRTPVKMDLGGDVGVMQHTLQGNTLFQGQNTKHFQQATSNSASFNPPKSYQGKRVMTHGQAPPPSENQVLNDVLNQVLNQYSQDQIQQSQLPNKASRDGGCVPSKPFNQCQPVSEFGPWQFPHMQRSLLYKQDHSSGDWSNVHPRPGQTQMGVSVDTLRKGDGDSGLQVEKSKLQSTAGGFVKDGFLSTQCTESNARLQTHNRNGLTRHGRPQSNHRYFLQPGNRYGSQRFGVGNGTTGTGKPPPPPQFLPLTYPVSDLRQSSFQVGVNSNANLSFRPSQPCGSGPSYRDTCDRMPEGEFAASNPNIAFPMGQSAESTYPDMASTRSPPQMTKNRGGPRSQLHYYLEECYDQLACLEEERKKSVILLKETFPGRGIFTVTSCPLPKMPPNPSRVDRLIVAQICEQVKVGNLLGKMEHLSSFPFHGNISLSQDCHYEAICATQSRRREECINTASRQKQGGSAHHRDDKDLMLLVVALKDLCIATRKLRTALWYALQVTVPMSASVLDIYGDAETTGTGDSSASA